MTLKSHSHHEDLLPRLPVSSYARPRQPDIADVISTPHTFLPHNPTSTLTLFHTNRDSWLKEP